MRILVRHGHFAFYPDGLSDIARFCKITKMTLERNGKDEFYTFPILKSLKDFSLPVLPYGNLPAKALYEGNPWEVMKANGYVYSLALKLLVPKEAITSVVNVSSLGYYFSVNASMLQPGSLTQSGQRLMSYDGEFDLSNQKIYIREFQFE